MKIAIHQNNEMFNHSTVWGKPWIEFCEKNKSSLEIPAT